MEFEWDEAKNRVNIEKHGISFEQASRIFDGAVQTFVAARLEYGEARFKSIGRIQEQLVVVVIHTDRRGRTRIISARRANRKERNDYQTQIRTRADD
jgi:uncharacterized protein